MLQITQSSRQQIPTIVSSASAMQGPFSWALIARNHWAITAPGLTTSYRPHKQRGFLPPWEYTTSKNAVASFMFHTLVPKHWVPWLLLWPRAKVYMHTPKAPNSDYLLLNNRLSHAQS